MSLQPKWSLPLSKLDNQKRANTRAVLPEVTNPVRPTNFFRVDPKKIAGTAKLVLNVSDLLNKNPQTSETPSRPNSMFGVKVGTY